MNRSDLRRLVLMRDQACVLALIDPTHECADRWGYAHLHTDVQKLTLGHIKEHPGGMRRDDPGWCIAQCARSNELHEETTKAHRGLVLAYLRGYRAGLELDR